ncbi:hypothetical protein AYI69_g1323 [Smittium culicis]|uniref:Uncharacterized protein n=1 Tax=Smittium culicis TaxID=133412 RepID=A0A1R1YQR0_9FUNG|nr:hypothetical protein AYI69_g1323 [Smittium culicis]
MTSRKSNKIPPTTDNHQEKVEDSKDRINLREKSSTDQENTTIYIYIYILYMLLFSETIWSGVGWFIIQDL